MEGLLANTVHALTSIKSTKVANRTSVLKVSKRAAEEAKQNAAAGDPTVEPDIKTNQDAQEEANKLNMFHLVGIEAKEGVAMEISKIVGTNINDSTLHTTDGHDFKSVDEYTLNDLM